MNEKLKLIAMQAELPLEKDLQEALVRFAALVAAECARKVEEPFVRRSWPYNGLATADFAAAVIRAEFPMPKGRP